MEIGAMAGAGLALLSQGKVDAARAANLVVAERIRLRTDWFQGRELVAALAVRVLVASGDPDAAGARLRFARNLAESSDFYSAAWLTAECAEDMLALDPASTRQMLETYSDRVQELGFKEMRKRYEVLLSPVRTDIVTGRPDR